MDKRFLFYVTAHDLDSDTFLAVLDRYREVQKEYLTRARALAAWDAKGAVGDLHVQVKMTWTATQTVFMWRFPLLAAFGLARLDWYPVPLMGGYYPRTKVVVLDRFHRLTRVYGIPYKQGGLAMTIAMVLRGLLPGGREAYYTFEQERIDSWDASREYGSSAWYIRKGWEESAQLARILKEEKANA